MLASLLLPAARAVADGDDEIEHRLKTAGIEAPLRERIHEAIRRGVRRLRGQQSASGAFRGTYGPVGVTALAGLALRHSVIPEGVEGGRAAIAWLRQRSAAVQEKTYDAGIAAMLLAADRSEGALPRALHERLRNGASSGYWGYRSSANDGAANLSTSQFGCLGLWACERLGVRRPNARGDSTWTHCSRGRGSSVSFVLAVIMGGVQLLWFVSGTPLERPVFLLAVVLGVLAVLAVARWQKRMSPFWRVILLVVAAAGLLLGPMLALGSPPPPPRSTTPPGLGSGTNPGTP